jgi:hypothetical protein
MPYLQTTGNCAIIVLDTIVAAENREVFDNNLKASISLTKASTTTDNCKHYVTSENACPTKMLDEDAKQICSLDGVCKARLL